MRLLEIAVVDSPCAVWCPLSKEPREYPKTYTCN